VPGIDPTEWTPPELRHSFVSVLSDAGIPVEQIAQLVGHRGTTVTELVYRHQLPGAMACKRQHLRVGVDGGYRAAPGGQQGSSGRCRSTSIRRRRRMAVAMFANAAAGSAKNIVPKRLITMSNAPGAN
jgi:hypothetical protein